MNPMIKFAPIAIAARGRLAACGKKEEPAEERSGQGGTGGKVVKIGHVRHAHRRHRALGQGQRKRRPHGDR